MSCLLNIITSYYLMQKYFLVIYSQCCGELKDHIHIYKYLPYLAMKNL